MQVCLKPPPLQMRTVRQSRLVSNLYSFLKIYELVHISFWVYYFVLVLKSNLKFCASRNMMALASSPPNLMTLPPHIENVAKLMVAHVLLFTTHMIPFPAVGRQY